MLRKIRNVARGVLQVYGPESLKKRLWDSEFARGSWECLDTSAGDYVYPVLERFARGGSILDLGCGSGSTGFELSSAAYSAYLGVDISSVAVQTAQEKAKQIGRGEKNRYLRSDILPFVPPDRYDVILFRDSIYYIALDKIVGMLTRYAAFLTPDGVFVVRIFDVRGKHRAIVEMIEANFAVVAKEVHESQTCVIAFRPSAGLPQ